MHVILTVETRNIEAVIDGISRGGRLEGMMSGLNPASHCAPSEDVGDGIIGRILS